MGDEPTIAAVLNAIDTVRDSINQRLDDVRTDLKEDVQALRNDHANLSTIAHRIELNQAGLVTKVKEHDEDIKVIKNDYIGKSKLMALIAGITAILSLVGAAIAAVGHSF